MESGVRGIVISFVAVICLGVVALVAAAVIPFNVDQDITLRDIEGTVELLTQDGTLVTLDTSTELKIGQTILVQPNSSATIVFFDAGGRALITGPASLQIVQIYRRATGSGHLFDSRDCDYVLTLDQAAGSVRYVFDNASPAFEDIDFTIRLSGGNYIPSTPCWLITVDAEGEATTESIRCSF